jgi:TBC1 domain family member 5
VASFHQNPWEIWFSDLSLRKEIRLDVERTFPDIPYFRSSDIQDQMTDILFVWAKMNEEVGYRQGKSS